MPVLTVNSVTVRRVVAVVLTALYVAAAMLHALNTLATTVTTVAADEAVSCGCCSAGGCGDDCCCGGDETPPTDALAMSGSCDMDAPAPPLEWRHWSLPKHLPATACGLAEAAARHDYSERPVAVLLSADLAPPAPIPIAI